jgi:phospholysine phosphohistidine inorganic pyrophosphate phosphatase
MAPSAPRRAPGAEHLELAEGSDDALNRRRRSCDVTAEDLAGRRGRLVLGRRALDLHDEGVRGVLLDLDGVFYVDDAPLPGAAATVDWLTREGVPYLYVTNTTSRSRQEIVDGLTGMGLQVAATQILTPAVAAKAWLRRHDIKHPALFVPRATAKELAELQPLPEDAERGAGAVVIGDLGSRWDFALLNRAFRLLMDEPAPPLIGLGLTRYWRAAEGLRLDAGPFVRALEYGAGRTAVVLGKPDPAFYRTAVDALALPAEEVVMVGDDIRTDVEGGQRAGLTGVLVRTGKFSQRDLDRDVSPDAVLDSIADLPRWWAER